MMIDRMESGRTCGKLVMNLDRTDGDFGITTVVEVKSVTDGATVMPTSETSEALT